MSTEHHLRVSELFLAASKLASEVRQSFLESECEGDESLRRDVESLLAHHDDPVHSLDQAPILPLTNNAVRRAAGGTVSGHIGRYRIISVLGEGGMGVVYLAEQDRPNRQVALKVMKPGYASRTMLRRFELETEVLGRLQHPGIAQIHDAGTEDAGSGAQPFFAMEYIRGEPLTHFVQTHSLGTRHRLQLMVQIANAVQHAHQHGVIHRDLKPSNILVNDQGQPKILDFGIARATDSDIQTTTLQTDIGQLIGTIPYMSPEQVAGDPRKLDVRLDVYALGVITYELLADRLPHDLTDKTIPEAVRIIGETDPTPLSSVNRIFRGDLDTVVSKAIEKDPERRYQSASELAQDIQRYLDDRPIIARPPSTAYQFRKFAKRNKALVGGAMAVFLALVVGLIATSWQATVAANQRDIAQIERAISQAVNEFLNEDLLSAVDPRQQGKDITMREALDVAASRVDERFPNQPLVKGELFVTIGRTYGGLGEHELSADFYRRAVSMYEPSLGDDNPRTLSARHGLANAYRILNKVEQAEPILRDVLSRQLRVLGLHHVDTLATKKTLAAVVSKSDNQGEAEELLHDILKTPTQLLPADHRIRISALGSLGGLLLYSDRAEESVPILKEALGLAERVHGPDHPLTMNTLQNYAVSLRWSRRSDEAEPFARRYFKTCRRVLGDEHISTLIAANDLVFVLLVLKRFQDAEAIVEEAYTARRKFRDDDDFGTQTLIQRFVDVYDQWHAEEPDAGHDATAEQWRAKVTAEHRPEFRTPND